jgi:urease accessory protein
MLTFTTKLAEGESVTPTMTVSLTAEERTKCRDRLCTTQGDAICFKLPRGTILKNGDLLQTEDREAVVQILAKPEAVLTVTAANHLDLLKAAYHLGNRHVPLEIHLDYLRLSPDSVLQDMLQGLGLEVVAEIAPFQPESGAYSH